MKIRGKKRGNQNEGVKDKPAKKGINSWGQGKGKKRGEQKMGGKLEAGDCWEGGSSNATQTEGKTALFRSWQTGEEGKSKKKKKKEKQVCWDGVNLGTGG